LSKSNALENDFVDFLFNATAMPSYGGNLYLSLHTADPGEAGDQETNEVSTSAYTSYVRVAVSRDNTGWTVSGSGSTNAALVQFSQCTGGTGATITHLGIGTSLTGPGILLASGALTASLAVSNLVQPQFAASAISYTED